MKREYPCVIINLGKIRHNTKEIIKLCSTKAIDVVGVSKVFCARRPIVQAMLDGGVKIIGDSRIENLKRIENFDCKKMLLRIPMESNAADVVKYSDVSLNSELDTVKCLAAAAERLDKTHHIILMIDVGDLREGILEEDVIKIIEEINKLPNIKLDGLGTNLTCYGGVIPDKENLGRLINLKKKIAEEFGIELSVVSGGNSSSLHTIVEGTIPEGVNQLRIGEAIVLGRETAYGNSIANCYRDGFTLKGEIIEIKEKPSVPNGKIGMDAFGNIPRFEDKGIIKRAIVALGRQDIVPEGLECLDNNIEVLGASSDHLIVNISNSKVKYEVGDIIDFQMDYGCLLRSMTSPYVKKYYTEA
jgi:predicted amino acid racemase